MIYKPTVEYNRWSAGTMFFVSLAVIALQLMLMRALSVSHYYHFSYLVISTALLGFGASGTFLAFLFDRLKQSFSFWNQTFLLLFLISLPVCYRLARRLPLDTQYLLYSGEQLLLLIAFNLLVFIPFFFGGLIIGFMLSFFKKEVPELYGVNLAGSGAGAISALGIMYLVPATRLPEILIPFILLSMVLFFIAAGLRTTLHSMRSLIFLLIGILTTLTVFITDPPRTVDPYKSLAHFRQLELQGDAVQLAEVYGPRGQIDVFRSPTFHQTLFAGPQTTTMPPGQLALLIDGHLSGSIFSIEQMDEAGILDFTPQSLPYRLLERPEVLLLGETDGVNIWLARRMGAEKITVVQPNPQILRLMRNELEQMGGDVFSGDQVEVVNKHPRLFLEQSERQFDLIQYVAGETMTAGTGGLQGLNEDYLLTVESVSKAREMLTENGLVSITRGIQSPPRDNLKILSMFIEAVRDFSPDFPEEHLLVSRNYLAANTILLNSPVNQERLSRFRSESENLQLDIEYFPGIHSDEIRQKNRIEGPEGVQYSYIHHALNRMLFDDPESFFREWVYDVRPPVDNRPYFQDFFKWESVDRFREAYGSQWLQRLELGFVILLITFFQLSLIAILLILVPFWFRRSRYTSTKNKLPAFLHFFMIGTGFMMLEITFMQIFTKFLGDPIYSISAVLASILVFSGMGSHLQKKLGKRLPVLRRIRVAVASIVGLTLLLTITSNPLQSVFISLSTTWRLFITILLIMPVSFFLGWLFPAGIEILDRHSARLIPWAWGVNGFASVTAAPLAILLSMSFGFQQVLFTGLGCYLVAGFTSWFWKDE